ncbi:perlucin-like protein [Argopecten irradians]|uniref:perlucin-like protein n=1 Tax=Argopecten irradians TaxID=31199 RepID=UPI003719443D
MKYTLLILVFLGISVCTEQILPGPELADQDTDIVDLKEHLTEIHRLLRDEYLQQYESLMSSLKGIVIFSCGEGWEYFEDYCYWFSRTKRSFQDARENCQSMGADLVDVTGFQENRFIKYHMRVIRRENPELRYYYLGGTDSDSEGQWVWVRTGQNVGFTDWQRGEPSNSNGNEDCIILNGERLSAWNDAPCAEEYYPICEKRVEYKQFH